MMHITQHFTLAEVEFSQTATRKGIDNSLPPELIDNVKRQAELMERVRYELNTPIHITSWYRCHELNAAIGGSGKSVHPLGLACDFVSSFGTPLEICRALKDKLEFDQLIDEGTWVHIGLSLEPLRHEILTARFPNGKAVYTKGLT
jgi:zinc D-Ala-D-Ala carboxypeptidase